jgi:hypothetical protein
MRKKDEERLWAAAQAREGWGDSERKTAILLRKLFS